MGGRSVTTGKSQHRQTYLPLQKSGEPSPGRCKAGGKRSNMSAPWHLKAKKNKNKNNAFHDFGSTKKWFDRSRSAVRWMTANQFAFKGDFRDSMHYKGEKQTWNDSRYQKSDCFSTLTGNFARSSNFRLRKWRDAVRNWGEKPPWLGRFCSSFNLLSADELRGWKLASAALMRSLCSTRLLPNSALRLDDRADSINPHPGHLTASVHVGG